MRVRRPDLRGIADREGARLACRSATGRSGSSDVLEAARSPVEPLRQTGRRSAETFADRPHARRREQELGRRQEHGPVDAPVVRWSVGSNDRSESISSPKNSIRMGRSIEGGNTSTMPPRRANSPRPATSVTGV